MAGGDILPNLSEFYVETLQRKARAGPINNDQTRFTIPNNFKYT